MRLPSGKPYVFLANLAPYGEDHVIMATEEGAGQVLSEQGIVDLLQASAALGDDYEGSFTSFSGASVKHWHGQFYRLKTPVWRNLTEHRLPLLDPRHQHGVLSAELGRWPARTLLFKGRSPFTVAAQVWQAAGELVAANMQYNAKFLHTGTGEYVWLLAPRLHGFMTFAGHFLAPRDEVAREYVSGCGSIESPGGDAVMFFHPPQTFTLDVKGLMARRFADTLRATSNWSWQPAAKASVAATTRSRCRRRLRSASQDDGGPRLRVGHRVESLAAAEAAISAGFDAIEIDVQLTRDGVLVAQWGDVDCTDGTRTHVFARTFAQIGQDRGAPVMKVHDLCHLARGRLLLCFDLKDWSDAIAGYRRALFDALVELVGRFHLEDVALFESFNLDYLSELREQARSRGLNLAIGAQVPRRFDLPQTLAEIGMAKSLGASSVFLYPEQLTSRTAHAVVAAGMCLAASGGSGVSDDVRAKIGLDVVDVVNWSARRPQAQPPTTGAPDPGAFRHEDRTS